MSILERIGFMKKDSRSVIFDIGTASVGGAYIRSENNLPHILYHGRWQSTVDDFDNFERYFTHTLDGLADMGGKITGWKGYKRPGHVACFLPSILYVSEIRTITFRSEKPRKITPELIEEIITEDLQTLSVNMDFGERIPGEKPVFIAREIIGFKLNGYTTEYPYGKTASEIKVIIFLAYTSHAVIKRLKEKILTIINVESIEFYGTVYAVYKIIGKYFADEKNFILYNVTGEVAELLIVRAGKLSKIVSYPFGTRTLVRRFRDRMKINYAEGETLLKLYIEGGINRHHKEKVEEALLIVKREWKVSLSLVFDRISGHIPLPSKIFIANAGIYSDFLKNWFLNERRELLLPEKDLSVYVLKENFLIQNFYISNQDYTDDVVLVLEAIFTNEKNLV